MDVGLQTRIDAELFLQCAEQIALEARYEYDAALVTRAVELNTYLWANLANLYSATFCGRLADLQFVPVRTTGESSTRLACFSESALPRDHSLVWTVMPVLLSTHTPPEYVWPHLRIVTPPTPSTVLAHVACLTNTVSLDRWSFEESPIEVFTVIYAYLQKHWSELASELSPWEL